MLGFLSHKHLSTIDVKVHDMPSWFQTSLSLLWCILYHIFYVFVWSQITKFMGPTWVHLGPVSRRWTHVGPMNLAIRDRMILICAWWHCDMEVSSTSLAFAIRLPITSGFMTHRSSNREHWYFFYCFLTFLPNNLRNNMSITSNWDTIHLWVTTVRD